MPYKYSKCKRKVTPKSESIFYRYFVVVFNKTIIFCGRFNKTITSLALVGLETDLGEIGATLLVDYPPSHIQRAVVE